VRDSDENTRVTGQGPWARTVDVVDGTLRMLAEGASWSGHERNHLFFGGLPNHQFSRLSGISGLDDPGDSRAFATLDIDHDGWLDVALVNVSAPRLRLLRNGIGDRPSSATNRFIAVRFVGGNQSSEPSGQWSAREGFGSYVELDLGGGRKIYREHRIDDGFKAQNSATMLVGIGESETVHAVNVRWLSGVEQAEANVAAGQMVTVYEDPSQSPTGRAFVITQYGSDAQEVQSDLTSSESWKPQLLPLEPSPNRLAIQSTEEASLETNLILYTAVATWCDDCTGDNPDLRTLRNAFAENDLAMFGVPIDKADTPEQLRSWGEGFDPSYDLLVDLPESELSRVEGVLRSELRDYGRVPASIITDSEGRVLLSRWGIPTVSEVRKLIWTSKAS